jgi:hypothetical protein
MLHEYSIGLITYFGKRNCMCEIPSSKLKVQRKFQFENSQESDADDARIIFGKLAFGASFEL